MISLVALGVVCLMLIGVVLIRERYWRRRFEVMEREYLEVTAQKDRLIRSAMWHDD